MDRRIEISNAESRWLRQYQPALLYFEESGVKCLQGTLHISTFYEKGFHKLVINPSHDQIAKNKSDYINDYYEISVRFDFPSTYEIASVREIGGRLERFAKRKEITLDRLHVYANTGGRLCLHGYFSLDDCLPNGFNIKDFVSNLLIPFFYGQSVFEKTNKWPLGQYLHANNGKFQNFLEKYGSPEIRNYLEADEDRIKRFVYRLTQKNNNFRERHPCICDSKDRIKDCKCGFKDIINGTKFSIFMQEFRKYFSLVPELSQSHFSRSIYKPNTGSRFG